MSLTKYDDGLDFTAGGTGYDEGFDPSGSRTLYDDGPGFGKKTEEPYEFKRTFMTLPCPNCGDECDSNELICPNCGASLYDLPKKKKRSSSHAEGTKKEYPVTPDIEIGSSLSGEESVVTDPDDGQGFSGGEAISDNIMLCPDGKYRWVYEMHLIKNPAIFFLIWKIFFFIFLGIFAVTFLADLKSWGLADAVSNLKPLGIFLLGMTVVIALGYLVYAGIMGWRYCVLFEMDEEGVNHKQMMSQVERSQMIADLAVLTGITTKNPTTIGVGKNVRTEMYSDFAHVKKVIPRRFFHIIKVNGLLDRNQVYADPVDYDFVLDYIRSHCPKVK